MAVVKVDFYFEFYTSGDKQTTKSFDGKDGIPSSTWKLSCCRAGRVWQVNVDLEEYEKFNAANVIATGKANVRQELDDDEEDDVLRSIVLGDSDLATIQLKNLTSGRVWSFEEKLMLDAEYIVAVDIVLFCNNPPLPCLEKIHSDFSELLKNGTYSDLVLVAEEKVFKVHKNILSSRSVVFQRMLDTEMKEKEENRVEIEDVKSDVLEKMLMFMYTGTLDENIDVEQGFLEDLFNVAEKYAITDLKQVMAQKICSDITMENVGRRFLLADQFDEKALRMKCFEFMKDNWVQLSNQDRSFLF